MIVGAGGLGCPSALYLAGAGIGTIGIVDYDCVEINNLHRQLLFTESDLHINKANAAACSLEKLNSKIKIIPHNIQLDSENALDIIQNYDIIVDATDNVVTRYLLNDACVLLKKPLVSGSALQLEGQLTVYNYAEGPCYRCLFPVPPPPESVTSCGDGGVIGAVTGVIGALQALEVIKIILENDGVLSGRLLLFDGDNSTFRRVRIRGRRENCNICSDKPIITELIDYEEYCGSRANDKNLDLKILNNDERINVRNYKSIIDSEKKHILIDVRNENEYEICKLESSINIPLKRLLDNKSNKLIDEFKEKECPIYVVCRRGNDSQIAVRYLKRYLSNFPYDVQDIIGGLHQWSYQIDPEFPIY